MGKEPDKLLLQINQSVNFEWGAKSRALKRSIHPRGKIITLGAYHAVKLEAEDAASRRPPPASGLAASCSGWLQHRAWVAASCPTEHHHSRTGTDTGNGPEYLCNIPRTTRPFPSSGLKESSFHTPPHHQHHAHASLLLGWPAPHPRHHLRPPAAWLGMAPRAYRGHGSPHRILCKHSLLW